MPDLSGRLDRLMDLSKVRDSRYKSMGFSVNDDNRARCTAELCEWILSANGAHAGTSPFPYGLFFLKGNPGAIPSLPPDLARTPFMEVLPCDRIDPRAAKLTWNEIGTEAEFSFAQLAQMLGIDAPKGTTLWFEGISMTDPDAKPLLVVPLGDRIQRQRVNDVAAASQPPAPEKS
ncbi:MAG TPA: hypothetical protein VD969_12625 [Symbiobacteriaceae bacterium]|nr:hypothetical protein [Symbiobacteriaceae bacterium]